MHGGDEPGAHADHRCNGCQQVFLVTVGVNDMRPHRPADGDEPGKDGWKAVPALIYHPCVDARLRAQRFEPAVVEQDNCVPYGGVAMQACGDLIHDRLGPGP